ncbi:MAG: SLATT domain-containing protein [Chitinophagaceae bacterium]
MAYDWTKPSETLELIKANILTAMKKEEDWYEKYTKRHSFFSRSIRFFSILLFAFGTLCPLLNIGLNEKNQIGLNWGYISLAIGGLLLLIDKYLGVSSGYVRFYIAKLDIQKNTLDFIENWDIESAKASNPLTTENIVGLLNTVKAFRQAVFTTIQVETGAWATEFQTQTGELYELFKQKQSEYKAATGNISVILENYSAYSEIEIILDDRIINNRVIQIERKAKIRNRP